MQRREFLTVAAGAAFSSPFWSASRAFGHEGKDHKHADTRIFASPAEAMKSPRETLAYVVAVYNGTGVKRPDYLATIDLDPASKTYSQVIHRLPMPNVGDELHHYGWNACGSCHGLASRRQLVIPGLYSSRIHIVDTENPREPKLVKVIEPAEVIGKTKLTAPHTVHCLADGRIMISMLGNEQGEGPGGFLLLDDKFEIAGRWEADLAGMNYNYDFWYQPRHDVMVSSEWAAPKTTRPGFKLEDVQAGKYGHHLHFWDWTDRKIAKSVDLGETGMIPLEVRFHHDPDSTHGFVGAALSSTMWHWHKPNGDWQVEKVIEVEPVETEGWPFPVPGLITDLVLSMDDRWLYFSNWLHGDIRQYDVSDPSKPKLAGRVWLGGVIGKPSDFRRVRDRQEKLTGGPQMLQLSLDGKRLYVTNSLVSSWDDQFYPAIGKEGSYLLQVDCDTDKGGLAVNEKFHVDFGKEPHGPARAHEIRFPHGDSTSDIWI
ncbi:MAG: selenium-binding family protein [Planctomycetales bacterium]